MFWTRAILWKIIKVLEYLIGMVRYFPARKKNYFFCPILDTSTLPKTHIRHKGYRKRDEAADVKDYPGTCQSINDHGFIFPRTPDNQGGGNGADSKSVLRAGKLALFIPTLYPHNGKST